MIAKPKFLFDNRLDDATPVASSTASGYSVLNLRDWRPYTYWRPSSLPATVTVPVSPPARDGYFVDYLLLAGHEVFSKRCVLQLQMSTTSDFSGAVTSVVSTNMVSDPDDLSTPRWGRNGSIQIRARDAVAPDGTRTACWIENMGALAVDDVYQIFGEFLPSGNAWEPSLYLRRNSTSGVLVMANHYHTDYGQWLIDFSALSNGWEWITRSHPAVTVVHEFQDSGIGNGFRLWRDSGTSPLSFHLWRAGANACRADARASQRALNNHEDRIFLATFRRNQVPGYWRVVVHALYDGTAPAIGIVAFGQALESDVYLESGFDPRGRETVRRLNRSISGVPLGSVIEHELFERTLRFTDVSWDWLRNAFEPAWRAHLRARPFAFAWDPAGHPHETVLVSATGGYTAAHRSGGYCTLEVPVQGVIEE